jgi:hypothetical protein
MRGKNRWFKKPAICEGFIFAATGLASIMFGNELG